MAVVFYLSAVVAVLATIMVITRAVAAHALLYLIVSLLAVALDFYALGAPFVAALEVIVYAGAIMVLFLFVIMLLDVKREEAPPGSRRGLARLALLLGLFLAAQLGAVLARLDLTPRAAEWSAGPAAVARLLFAPEYLYAFEATSVLILAALVGAVALAKREP